MLKKTAGLLLSAALTLNIACVSYADTNNDEAIATYTKIQELYYNKQYDACIELCSNIINNDEMYMDAYYYTAMSAFYSNNTELAYDTLLKQLKLNPNNQLALYNGACAAAMLGKDSESVELLERLVELDVTEKSNIKSEHDLDSIRDNAEYKRLMEISVTVGGQLVEFDVAPIITDGRTLLPLRKIFECLGADVTYDEKTATAVAVKDNLKLEIPVSSKTVKVNDQEKELDVPAMLVDGRTLVPVRFVAESLRAEVIWDGENEVVDIRLPMPSGTAEYEPVKETLDNNSAVFVVDGMFPEPYILPPTEGASMIILKDKTALDAFDTLSKEDKSRYVSETVYNNYALVVGCDPVHAKVIYDGKIFYEGLFSYNSKDELMELSYYANGKPANIVKQFKSKMNYIDYALLSEDEKITSSIND